MLNHLKENHETGMRSIKLSHSKLSHKIFLEETKNPVLDYQLIFDRLTKNSPLKFQSYSESILLQQEIFYSILEETYVSEEKSAFDSSPSSSPDSDSDSDLPNQQDPRSNSALPSLYFFYPGVYLKVISHLKLLFYRDLKKDLLFWFFEIKKKAPVLFDQFLVFFKTILCSKPFLFRKAYQHRRSFSAVKNKYQIAFEKLYPSLDFLDLSFETFLIKKNKVSLIKTINLSWDVL